MRFFLLWLYMFLFASITSYASSLNQIIARLLKDTLEHSKASRLRKWLGKLAIAT